MLAGTFGLDPAQIRVIAPDVGGGFGAKMLSVEEILVVWLARRLGRPVRWTETRTESMVALPHGRGQELTLHDRRDRDGKVLAFRLDILADVRRLPGPRRLPAQPDRPDVERRLRDPDDRDLEPRGRHEHDPDRARSAAPAGRRRRRRSSARWTCSAIELSWTRSRSGAGTSSRRTRSRYRPHHHGDLRLRRLRGRARPRAALGRLRRAARRAAAPPRARAGRSSSGSASARYVEITNPVDETEFGEVEITADGGAIVRTGSFSHGQGHETTFAMIAAEQLGLPLEKITVVKGDTDEIASGHGHLRLEVDADRRHGGTGRADEVVEQRQEARRRLPRGEPVRHRARHRRSAASTSPARPALALSWAELAARADGDGRLVELKAAHEFQGAPTFPFGAHIAVVEVDIETAQVELLRLVAVDDAGTLINPLVAEGQVHGGVATGVAQALYEHVTLRRGRDAADAAPSSATPSRRRPTSRRGRRSRWRRRRPANPLGAKGIGESGTIGSTPAVHNAVDRRARAVRRAPRRDARERRERVAGPAGGEGMTRIALTVNGARHEADVEPRALLVYFLREELGLKGTNVGCDTSSCGACTVLLDGESVKSCTVLAVQADGSEVTTIEGLASGDELHPVQQAFHEQHALAVRLLHAGLRDGVRLAPAGEPESVRGGDPPRRSRATSAAAPGTTTSSSGTGGREGAAHDPRRLRVRARRVGRPRRSSCSAGEDAKLLAGGQSLIPAAAAPFRAPVGARRRRPARRPALRARGRRPDRDRRAHAGTPSSCATRCSRSAARLIPQAAGAHRRPAGAPPRHDRRLGRARRPGVRPRHDPAHARRRARRARAGRRADDPGHGVLHGPVRDRARAAGDADRDPRAGGRGRHLPQAGAARSADWATVGVAAARVDGRVQIGLTSMGMTPLRATRRRGGARRGRLRRRRRRARGRGHRPARAT